MRILTMPFLKNPAKILNKQSLRFIVYYQKLCFIAKLRFIDPSFPIIKTCQELACICHNDLNFNV